MVHTREVDVDDAVPFVGGDLEIRVGRGDPGEVDEGHHLRKLRLDHVERGADGRLVGDVRAHPDGLHAEGLCDVLRDGLRFGVIEVDHSHVPSALGQVVRCRLTDPPGGGGPRENDGSRLRISRSHEVVFLSKCW
jgi:hypothetical protein